MTNEEQLKLLTSRYQQKIFALVLYLIGGDQDKAYEAAAVSFAEAISKGFSPEKEEALLTNVASLAIEKSRNIKTIPVFEQIDMMNIPAEEKKSLRLIQAALQALPFEAKVLLLLRDQLHLPYKDISDIMSISESNARVQTEQARSNLREKIEEILNREG